MSHNAHVGHAHAHGEHCGHMHVQHEGHVDYLHDGHLHSTHGDHYDECVIAVSKTNPTTCAPATCACGHEGCGHAEVPHGDHVDYLVEGRLHRRHGDHCDDHGPVL